jgi:CheY-like chemotaxis protein
MAHILVIEDDSAARRLLTQLLEDAGHTVSCAVDGEHGLTAYRAQPADLVITDIFMPNKEGLETARELKAEFPSVKIIAVTGGGSYTMYDSLQWIQAMGVSQTFIKPFDPDEMLEAVDRLLSENS